MNKVSWINRVVGAPGPAVVPVASARLAPTEQPLNWLNRPIPGILPRNQADVMRPLITIYGAPSKMT